MTPTFGHRYVFARLEQRVVSAEIRLNWTFTPRLSLQAYLQPFIAVGAYSRFKELARPAKYEYNLYGENSSTVEEAGGGYTIDPDGTGPASPFTFGNPDFNVKSLRGTVVFRWEYLPGSLIYLVWTQNRADYAKAGVLNLRRDFSDLLGARRKHLHGQGVLPLEHVGAPGSRLPYDPAAGGTALSGNRC